MQHEVFEFEGADDAPLNTYCWRPESPAKAVVQIVHGMAEHAARYARLAEALTAAGYAVIAGDLRGHGETAATDDELGFFAEHDGWIQVVADLGKQTERIKADFDGLPVILFGHSMGSFLSQQLMIEKGADYAAVVLSGSNGPVGPLRGIGALMARLEVLRLGARGRSGLLTTMSFGAFNKPYKPPRTDFDWLSRDEAEVDKYVADAKCGFMVCASLWRDMLDGLGALHTPAALARIPKDLPVYILAGSEDPVSNQTKGLEKLLALYQDAGLTAVTHRFYDGARHELLNEINRDEVTADLIVWLDALA